MSGIGNLTGGAGTDTLEGDANANILDGGANTDTLSYENAATAVSVSLAVAIAQNTSGAGVDTIKNFENLTGSAANDWLIGNNGNNVLSGLAGGDRINGGAGNDRMIGGGDDDTYYVSDAGDVIVEVAGGGSDTVFASISHTSAIEVENLMLTGTAAINGAGSAVDNTIVGNSAANILSGAPGNDTLDGGLGNDTLDGGLGNDTLAGGIGNDTLTGGAGSDLFAFAGAFGRDTVTDFVHAQDKIQISKTIFSSISDLLAHTADDGLGNTVISADANRTIVLLDMLKSELQISDFHLL